MISILVHRSQFSSSPAWVAPLAHALPKVGLQADKMRPALRDDQDLAGFKHVFPEKHVVDDDLVWFSDIFNVLPLFKYFFHGWVEHGWNHQPTNMMLYDQDMTKIYYIPRVSDPTASQKFSSRHRIALFSDPVGKQTVEFQYPVFVDIATLISAWPVFRSRPILTSKRKCWRRLRALTHYFVVAECDGIVVGKKLSVIL